MIKILLIIVCVLVCNIILKGYNKPFAMVLSIAGGVLAFVVISNDIKNIVIEVNDIASSVPNSMPYIKMMLKTLCVVIISQIVSQICKDNGEGALSSFTEISAKILVLVMVMPLFKTVVSILNGLVK